jgi:2,3-bisphosphoglycerate-independent phosphoglycerate mutase
VHLGGKIKAIEDLDKHFFSRLLDKVGDDAAFIITSDHATPWDKRAHSDDPVPVMVSWSGAPRGPGVFGEKACRDGPLGIIDAGFKLLPVILKMLGVR